MVVKFTAVFFLCFFSLVVFAGHSDSSGSYLNASSVDPKTLLQNPPAEGSPMENAELQTLHVYQTSRTSEDCARAQGEANQGFANWFGPQFQILSETEVADLTAFLTKVWKTSDQISTPAKTIWNRPRPFVTDPTLQPCVEQSASSFSYPSGHAANSYVMAQVLEEIFPDRADALEARAHQVALDRVIAGVHYPTDIQAGRTLGAAIFGALKKSAEFQNDLANAEQPH